MKKISSQRSLICLYNAYPLSWGGFLLSRKFRVRTDVKFTCVSFEIGPVYVKPRSTSTFTRNTSYIASILFTRLTFPCVQFRSSFLPSARAETLATSANICMHFYNLQINTPLQATGTSLTKTWSDLIRRIRFTYNSESRSLVVV